MPKGRGISIVEIMRHIQSVKGWSGIDVPGEDVIKYVEFQNLVVFDLGLTSDRRKVRELWRLLSSSPAVRVYNKKDDVVVVEVYKFNLYLAGADFGQRFRVSAPGVKA